MKKNAILLFLNLTVLTGIIYPLFITFFSNMMFPHQAKGSLIIQEDKIIGSELIGQEFKSEKYFWSRPSVNHYNGLPSLASNLGPTSEELKKIVKKRQQELMESHLVDAASMIPSDLVYSSGSGLDPHISLEAALFQVDRIVKIRGFNEKEKLKVIALVNQTARNHPKFLGPATINVLELNLALDQMKDRKKEG